MTFDGLPRGHYAAILADPPWAFPRWSGLAVPARTKEQPYSFMTMEELAVLDVRSLCRDDCVLFCWVTWPMLLECITVIEAWGFKYKTCAFNWTKAHAGQVEMFQDDFKAHMGMGYWTRANTEPCLLATRGEPKRLDAGVRQAIIEPRREHSRKPEGVHASIQRLVAGPYLELFARQRRPGWDCWGNEEDKFAPQYNAEEDFAKSIDEAYAAIRERKANGGKGWNPAMKWYKRDPDAALIGFRGLSHDAKSAYGTIIDLSYSRDGDVPDDDRFLCMHVECRPQWWRRVKAELIACGKLRVIDGKLVANRVEATLKEAAYFRETVAKLGRLSGVSRRKASEINEENEPTTTTYITTSFLTAAREGQKRKKKKKNRSARSLASALNGGALTREPEISASLKKLIQAKGWKS